MAENDPWCCYALARLWPEAHLFRDVRDVSAESLWRAGCWPIDLISGGFPCQDISTAGRGAGIEGSRSGLWREMFRIIRQCRPAWVLVENVPALRLRGADRVVAPLERIGYSCWPLVVGAWAVGAPHKRDRVWIVAYRPCRRQRTDGEPGSGVGHPDECGENISNATTSRCGPGSRLRSNGESRWRRQPTCMRQLVDRPRQQREQRPERDGVRECGQQAMADRDGSEYQESRSVRCDVDPELSALAGSRWPARPGEPQYDWEAPRLVEFGLGDATDGLAPRLRSRANKALLRVCGNGWVYPLARLIYQWIAVR